MLTEEGKNLIKYRLLAIDFPQIYGLPVVKLLIIIPVV